MAFASVLAMSSPLSPLQTGCVRQWQVADDICPENVYTQKSWPTGAQVCSPAVIHVIGLCLSILMINSWILLGDCFRRSNEVVRVSGTLCVRGWFLPLNRSEHDFVDIWRRRVDVWFFLLVTCSSEGLAASGRCPPLRLLHIGVWGKPDS